MKHRISIDKLKALYNIICCSHSLYTVQYLKLAAEDDVCWSVGRIINIMIVSRWFVGISTLQIRSVIVEMERDRVVRGGEN